VFNTVTIISIIRPAIKFLALKNDIMEVAVVTW
jgi:hypothetical protein